MEGGRGGGAGRIRSTSSTNLEPYRLSHHIPHCIIHLGEILHVDGIHVGLGDEALCVWILRSEGSQRGLHLHEDTVESAQRGSDLGVKEEAAIGYALQGGGALVGEAQTNK